MGKSVNVILNSNNKYSGTNTQEMKYFIDFGAILKPNQAYKMHWTYVGMPNTFTALTKLAQVQVDFTMNNYLNASSTNGAPTTYCIGTLRSFYLNGTTNYLFADDNNNPPIYLPTRPANNFITVRIYNNDATPGSWLDNATTPAPPGAYIMNLCFTEIEEDED